MALARILCPPPVVLLDSRFKFDVAQLKGLTAKK